MDIAAEVGSAINLTIEKTAANTLTISASSADADPLDLLLLGAQDVVGQVTPMTLVDGVASLEIYWPGAAPDTTSFEILWSKESTDGNWMITRDQLGQIDTSYTTDGSVIGGDTDTSTGGGTTGGDGGDPATPIDIGDVETSSAFLAGPDAPDMDSADVVSLFSDEYTSPLNGVIGWGDGVITEMDVNGNTVKKFDSSVWNIFDVPTDVSSGSAETLSISLFRTMSSDFEIKLVDTTNGGGEGIYYIPAAQMPVNQWVTVDIPMSSFRGNDSMTGGPIAADLNIDQLVVKPMNNYDPSVDGPRETFYMDDMYFSGSGIGVGTDTGTGTDTGGDTGSDPVDSGHRITVMVLPLGWSLTLRASLTMVTPRTFALADGEFTGSDIRWVAVLRQGNRGATGSTTTMLAIAEAGSNLSGGLA